MAATLTTVSAVFKETVMTDIKKMLDLHPSRSPVATDVLAETIEKIYSCVQSCTSCQDACLACSDIQPMVRCIRRCQDCRDICETTGKLLTRVTEADWDLMASQLATSVKASRACGTECEKTGAEHCKACAENCNSCADACEELLKAAPVQKAA